MSRKSSGPGAAPAPTSRSTAPAAGTDRPADLADLDVVEVTPKSATAGAAHEQAIEDAALALVDEVLHRGCGLVYERYSLFSPALSVLATVLDVPSVLEVNAPLIEEQQRYRQLVDVKKAETVLRRNAGTADVVACVSEPVVRWVRERVPAARTVLVPNGVNVAPDYPAPARPAQPEPPHRGLRRHAQAVARRAGPAARRGPGERADTGPATAGGRCW